MGLNFKNLNKFQDEITKRSEGDGLFFNQKEIDKETDIRILPALPSLNGDYFKEVIVFWFGKEKVISPATFGLPCPIMQMMKDAEDGDDADLKALLKDKDNFSKKFEYWMPILLLDVTIGDGVVEAIKVKDDKARVLNCSTMLMKRINKVVCSRTYMNGTPDGITDRVKGSNLILSKTGEKLNTEYDAQGDVQWEMDEKYYKNYPDVYKLAEDTLLPNDYLEGLMSNYLYGTPKPEKPKLEKKPTDNKVANTNTPAANIGRGTGRQTTAPAKAENTTGTRTARKPIAKPEPEVEAEQEQEQHQEPEQKPDTKKAVTNAGGKRRNVLDDLTDLDK